MESKVLGFSTAGAGHLLAPCSSRANCIAIPCVKEQCCEGWNKPNSWRYHSDSAGTLSPPEGKTLTEPVEMGSGSQPWSLILHIPNSSTSRIPTQWLHYLRLNKGFFERRKRGKVCDSIYHMLSLFIFLPILACLSDSKLFRIIHWFSNFYLAPIVCQILA